MGDCFDRPFESATVYEHTDCDHGHKSFNGKWRQLWILVYYLQDYVIAMNIRYLVLVFTMVVIEANADSSTLDAAIGGAIGGGAGAAIGNEIGGRDGAIIGGALGGAVGAAVTTGEESHHGTPSSKPHYDNYHPHGGHTGSHFCPPGQAKKGRC
jgi:hypothetical protein